MASSPGARFLMHWGKMPTPRGPTLLAGEDFTVEATEIAKAQGCDMVSVREFGWIDAAYAAIRLRR